MEGFPGVKEHVLGRVYTISPCQGECFYLWLLLHHVRGPQSFSDLRTVNVDLCRSFHEACFKLGLLEVDNQYHLAMLEASGRELSEYGLPMPQTVDNDRFARVPYTAKLSRGKTFAVGIEKDRSRENIRGSSISQ